MAELIRTLNRDAAIYRSFDEQPSGSAEALFFERLEALDITTVMPLVLLLFTDASISPARRSNALAALESWLVRRTLLRLTTKNYNLEVAQLLAKVDGDPEHADEVIREHLSSSTSDTSRWPDNEELIDGLETRDMYYSVAQARLAMVLRALELSLYDARVEIPSVLNTLSIEHVMPQSWEEHWPLPSIADPEERALRTSERTARLHRLGNLTLTTLPMNAQLSNSAWPVKQKALNQGSKLLLNSELVERYGGTFDESAIDERTVILARRICEIWPRK
jgi:hypothetical protein